MRIIILFLSLIALPLFAEDFICPPETLLIEYTPSVTKEKVKMCQKKVDGKFVKHGPEIIYNADGSIQSQKEYELDKIVTKATRPENKPVATKDETKNAVFSKTESTCALINNAVKCWGLNPGDGTNKSTFPKQVIGLEKNVNSLAMAPFLTCAILNKNEAKCWSDIFSVGVDRHDEFTKNRYRPYVYAVFNKEIKSIAVQADKTLCALTINDEVKCLDNYFKTKKKLPLTMSQNIQKISLTNSTDSSHQCFLSNGLVKCWGMWRWKQINENLTWMETAKPVPELDPEIDSIATGDLQHCFILKSGNVKCWGVKDLSSEAETPLINDKPVLLEGLLGPVESIAIGRTHACALLKSGEVQCWGKNKYGQLGNGAFSDSLSPVKVIDLPTKALSVSAGTDHSCALLEGDEIMCWGRNTHGQLGNGTKNSFYNKPVKVIDLK